MVKKTIHTNARMATPVRTTSRKQNQNNTAKVETGILVQDLGQLQRTCQELESALAQRTEELRILKDSLNKSGGSDKADLIKSNDLLDAIRLAQSQFILEEDSKDLFANLNRRILALTDSEFGFIGEVLLTPEGKPDLQTYAITNLALNEQAKRLSDIQSDAGMEFPDMEPLFIRVITEGEPVVANDPATELENGGTPMGHSPLKSFLGLPLYHANRLIGMVGLANRPGGYDPSIIDFLQPFLATCSTLITSHRNNQSRIKAEDSLARYHERLVHSGKLSSLGKLNANIVHEINNPIYGIRNVLEKIQESVPMGEKYRGFVALAVKECNRVKELIEKLQNFQKPSPGKWEPVHLQNTLEEVLHLVHPRLSEKKIRVVRNYAPGLPAVHAVADQLKQVVLNLLQNAEDAIASGGGEIVIATEKDETHVRFRIRDTGSGIHPDALSKLFDPFFTTKASTRGTGLGLSISSNIIHAHGGDITVTSGPGQGSEFHVTLPSKEHEHG